MIGEVGNEVEARIDANDVNDVSDVNDISDVNDVNNVTRLNMGKLNTGIYFIKLISNEASLVKKVVVK